MKTINYRTEQELKKARTIAIQKLQGERHTIITTVFSLRGSSSFRVIKNHVTEEYHLFEQK